MQGSWFEGEIHISRSWRVEGKAEGRKQGEGSAAAGEEWKGGPLSRADQREDAEDRTRSHVQGREEVVQEELSKIQEPVDWLFLIVSFSFWDLEQAEFIAGQ